MSPLCQARGRDTPRTVDHVLSSDRYCGEWPFRGTVAKSAIEPYRPIRRNRSFASKGGQIAAFSTMSAAFSPIMIDGALVLPDVSVGMIEASATRRSVYGRLRRLRHFHRKRSDPVARGTGGSNPSSSSGESLSAVNSRAVGRKARGFAARFVCTGTISARRRAVPTTACR